MDIDGARARVWVGRVDGNKGNDGDGATDAGLSIAFDLASPETLAFTFTGRRLECAEGV